jgi:hypothetical protein
MGLDLNAKRCGRLADVAYPSTQEGFGLLRPERNIGRVPAGDLR